MFDALAAAIDRLAVDRDEPVARDELVAMLSLRDRFEAKVLEAVGAYESSGAHEVDGAITMAAWLRHHGRVETTTATRLALRARKLARLPVLAAAFADGAVSGGQVDVVLAHVAARHLGRFAEHEAALVPSLVPLSVQATTVVMAEWRARADALDGGRPPAEHDNEVYLSRTIDGRGDLRGSLDADLHALVDAALRVADPKDFELTGAERRAAALGQVCQHFLDHQRVRSTGRHRPHLNVALSVEQFAAPAARVGATYVDTGAPVSPDVLGALRCDAAVHRVLRGPSGILDYGRATRTWPTDLYNAIVVRDQGCRWPGCDAPASWCDVHHSRPWEDGGPTSIDNGFLACRRHHHRGHEAGWETKLLPDGTIEFTDPAGRVETTTPRGPPERGQPDPACPSS